MRVTTGMIFNSGVASMQKQNTRLLDTQQQVAASQRVLRPSDDPVASARALEVTQSQGVNALYATNQGYANDALKLADSKLGAANDILTYVRTRAVESGNGGYNKSDRPPSRRICPSSSTPFKASPTARMPLGITSLPVSAAIPSLSPAGWPAASPIRATRAPARCRFRRRAICRSPVPATKSSTTSTPPTAPLSPSAPPPIPAPGWFRG